MLLLLSLLFFFYSFYRISDATERFGCLVSKSYVHPHLPHNGSDHPWILCSCSGRDWCTWKKHAHMIEDKQFLRGFHPPPPQGSQKESCPPPLKWRAGLSWNIRGVFPITFQEKEAKMLGKVFFWGFLGVSKFLLKNFYPSEFGFVYLDFGTFGPSLVAAGPLSQTPTWGGGCPASTFLQPGGWNPPKSTRNPLQCILIRALLRSYIVPLEYIYEHFNLSHPVVKRALEFRCAESLSVVCRSVMATNYFAKHMCLCGLRNKRDETPHFFVSFFQLDGVQVSFSPRNKT